MSETPFAEFYESLVKLAKSFEEKDLLIKIQPDLEANIIRIYGEKTDSLALAKIGLEGISELAYTTAEHHPYWSLIFNSSQILKIVLEKWHDNLTKEELDEILWNIDEIKNTARKLEEK
jgi:hypothetical protein